MTIEQIRLRVDDIRTLARVGDCEMAHSKEDDLLAEVLLAISKGAENPRELATESVKTFDISFSRWTA